MTLSLKKTIIEMLKDIHTHRFTDSAPEEVLLSCPVLENEIPAEAVYVSAEIHPWHLTAENLSCQIERMENMLSDSRVLALGEVGLDKLTECPYPIQIKAFEEIVRISESNGKPLIIHCVKSVDELIAIRKKMRPALPWIMHGFRGKPQQADSLLRHGFYLSFGEHYNSQVMKEIPIERLFLETDESNAPIDELYNRAAAIRHISAEELKLAVLHNVNNVFGVKKPL